MCFDPKQFNKNKDALMDCTNEFKKKQTVIIMQSTVFRVFITF